MKMNFQLLNCVESSYRFIYKMNMNEKVFVVVLQSLKDFINWEFEHIMYVSVCGTMVRTLAS